MKSDHRGDVRESNCEWDADIVRIDVEMKESEYHEHGYDP